MTTPAEKIVHTIKLAPHPVLAFCNLLQPRQYKGKGKFQYDAKLVFDSATHPDVTRVKELSAQAALRTFPAVPLDAYNKPWETGEEFIAKNEKALREVPGTKKIDPAPFLGKYLVAMRTEYPPELGMIENDRMVKFEGASLALAEKHIWSGQLVGASVEITAYLVDGRYYIKLYPKDIVSYGGGTRVASGPRLEDRWSEYTGHVTTIDPAAGMPGHMNAQGLPAQNW